MFYRVVAQFITSGSIYVNPFNIYIFNNNGELIQLQQTLKGLACTQGLEITMIVENIEIKRVDMNWAPCYKLSHYHYPIGLL